MKTKYLLVVTFGMGLIIMILISNSNTGLAFAAMTNSTWYHFGYDAACTDAKNWNTYMGLARHYLGWVL